MSKDKNRKNKKSIVICFLLIILSIFIIMSSFNNSPKESYEYKVNKKVDYKISVKENNFFKNDYIDMNQTYISSVLNKILANFNYEFEGNMKENINYSYDIAEVMNVKYSNNNENLWSEKNYIIENKQINLENENKFNIKESVEVNYNEYNNKAKQFKANFNIPIKSTLEIILTVKQKIDTKEKIEQIGTVSLYVNLNEDVCKIEQKSTGLNSYKQLENTKNVNVFMLIIGLIILIPSVSVVLKNTMKFEAVNNNVGTYSKAIKKILKNYGDVVAEIIKPIELNENTQIIDVKNFDQLLDVEEELRMPILFYEVERGKEGCFIIINNNVAYRYILRNKNKR